MFYGLTALREKKVIIGWFFNHKQNIKIKNKINKDLKKKKLRTMG